MKHCFAKLTDGAAAQVHKRPKIIDSDNEEPPTGENEEQTPIAQGLVDGGDSSDEGVAHDPEQQFDLFPLSCFSPHEFFSQILQHLFLLFDTGITIL